MYKLMVVSFIVAGVSVLVQFVHESDPIIASQMVKLHKESATIFKQLTSYDTLPVLFPFCQSITALNEKEPWAVGKLFYVVQGLPILGLLNSTLRLDSYTNNGYIEFSSSNIFQTVLKMRLKETLTSDPKPTKANTKKISTDLYLEISTKRRSLFVQWIIRPVIHYPIQMHLKHRLFAVKYLF